MNMSEHLLIFIISRLIPSEKYVNIFEPPEKAFLALTIIEGALGSTNMSEHPLIVILSRHIPSEKYVNF